MEEGGHCVLATSQCCEGALVSTLQSTVAAAPNCSIRARLSAEKRRRRRDPAIAGTASASMAVASMAVGSTAIAVTIAGADREWRVYLRPAGS